MKLVKIDNRSSSLIIFFAGWGCDENQFTNLHDREDVLILYDYRDLELDFDFSPYRQVDVLAYSAGVFAASAMASRLPEAGKKAAVNGNPYLFDEKYGLSSAVMDVLQHIDMDNYLDFRRQYMVETDDEFRRYNRLEVRRSMESCAGELAALQKLYEENKARLNPAYFERAVISDHDHLFALAAQKEFYGRRLRILPQSRHHVFFRFPSLRAVLDYAYGQ